MLRHSISDLSLTKNERRNLGREASNVWGVRTMITCSGISNAESRPDIMRKVAERISMRNLGPLLSPEIWRSTAWDWLRSKGTWSRQLEGSGVHGDSAGRNSSSLVRRLSQWTRSPTNGLGKSPLSTFWGINCRSSESPGCRACIVTSPSRPEKKIFGVPLSVVQW
jgi:hypothetical protein